MLNKILFYVFCFVGFFLLILNKFNVSLTNISDRKVNLVHISVSRGFDGLLVVAIFRLYWSLLEERCTLINITVISTDVSFHHNVIKKIIFFICNNYWLTLYLKTIHSINAGTILYGSFRAGLGLALSL